MLQYYAIGPSFRDTRVWTQDHNTYNLALNLLRYKVPSTNAKANVCVSGHVDVYPHDQKVVNFKNLGEIHR